MTEPCLVCGMMPGDHHAGNASCYNFPRAWSERDMFKDELHRLLLEAMSIEPIPISEDGSKIVVDTCLAAYRKVFPDYIITVEPLTEEDLLERRSPKIRIEFPKQISICVTVEK